MLKREVQEFEVVAPQMGEDFAPPTPLSAAASFGKPLFLIIKHYLLTT